MASAQLAKVIELVKSVPRDPNAEVGRMRGAMEKVSERVASDVKSEAVDAGGVKAEWIVPPNAAQDRVILYLHGGGYVMGSINTHRAMVARIARASEARALALDYRLAPEHPFPAAVEDAVAAYKWLLAQGYKPGENRRVGRLGRWRSDAGDFAGDSRSGFADGGGGCTDFAVERHGWNGRVDEDARRQGSNGRFRGPVADGEECIKVRRTSRIRCSRRFTPIPKACRRC